jgi:hypothetical protein
VTSVRRIGWERALLEIVARHRAQPFAWGASDCFTLPLEAIVALTGVDPWPGLHDYDSRLSAARCLASQGFASLADAFAAQFPEVPVPLAQRGDVGVIEDEATGSMCGALFLASGVAGKTETGLHIFPRDRVVRAFEVR